MTETTTYPPDNYSVGGVGAVEHTDSADDSATPTMSPVAVAYEIIRDTISQHNAYAASAHSVPSHGTSSHSDNAALARGVLEALAAQGLLVTTEDIQRRYEMLD